MSDSLMPLIHSKIHKPHYKGRLIQRQRLFEKLNRGLNASLMLVSAPAGFGKTTLVSTWLESPAAESTSFARLPSVWLTLDEQDGDLAFFVRYLIAAIREVFPNACSATLELIRSRQNPPVEVVSASLCNEIGLLKEDFILILDDYHCIKGDSVHQLIDECLKHIPAGLHLMIISRRNPPLPLASLRAKDLVIEIRSRDLRFARAETEALANLTLSARLTESDIDLLENLTEGWAAGLRLYMLALSGRSTVRQTLSDLSASEASIPEYLTEEVLLHQLPIVQNFLLKTSILDRFCAPLCEAVVKETDPAWKVRDCLDRVVKDELFITSFERNDEWFTYHKLFSDVLRKKLVAGSDAVEISSLHRSAAIWFMGNDFVEEALNHALKANDPDLVASVVGMGLMDVLNREDRPILYRWLQIIPDALIRRKPELLILKAWVAQFEWQLDVQSEIVGQVEELIEGEPVAKREGETLKVLQGQVLSMKAQEAYFSNQPQLALSLLNSALDLVPKSWNYLYGGILMYFGLSLHCLGRNDEALRFLEGNYDELAGWHENTNARVLQGLCFIHLNNVMLDQVRNTATLILERAIKTSLIIQNTWAWQFLGVVAYLKNELDEALFYFKEIVGQRYVSQILAVRDGFTGLALIYQARGNPVDAFRMVDGLIQIDLEQKGVESSRAASLRARLWLLNGDLGKASRWADSFKEDPQPQPMTWLEEPHLTKALILASRGTETDSLKALKLLDKLEANAEKVCNSRFRIEILAVRALALDGMGRTRESLASLRQALRLSETGGMVRPFIDHGPRMQALLRKLPEREAYEGIIQRISTGFLKEEQKSSIHVERKAEKTNSAGAPSALTPRELDILKLMREPISNRQIAGKLGLSYATVKRYSINLYEKLGVSNRWDAVAKGMEFGLLPSK